MARLLLTLLLFAVPLFGGAASAQSALTTAQKLEQLPGGSSDDKWNWYWAHRTGWAKAHEAEGDQLRAKGDAVGALDAYLKALGEIGVASGYLAWKVERDDDRRVWVVRELTPGKRAARAGLQVGDQITAIDGIPMTKVGQVKLDMIVSELGALPYRPLAFTVQRGMQTLPVSVDRFPILKFLFDASDRDYRDALAEKTLRFMVEQHLVPPVTDAMRWAAKAVQEEFRAAADVDAQENAHDDLRAATLAFTGWGDFYLNCGVLMEAAQDAIEAQRCLRAFLIVSPEDPQAAAVNAKLAALEPAIAEQRQLMAWEGFWGQVVDGRRIDSGFSFHRHGRIIEVQNQSGEVWMRGTITGEFDAEALQIFTTANAGTLSSVVARCFNGRMEASGSMHLAPDKHGLSITVNNDIDVDPNNCAIVRQNPSTLYYAK